MNSLWNDFVLACRVLLSPTDALSRVVTLAIGIASNTIIFGVARSAFSGRLYPDSKRLVYVVSQAYPGFRRRRPVCLSIYRDIVQHNKSFESLAAYQAADPSR